jgi:hypothetical protein
MQSFYNGLVESQQLATNWIDNTVAAYVEDAAPAALGGSGRLWAAMSSLGCSGLALLALGWLWQLCQIWAALGCLGLGTDGSGRLSWSVRFWHCGKTKSVRFWHCGKTNLDLVEK